MTKVVHVALTPLAGSPIRIVNALNKHTGFDARLITLDSAIYGGRIFEGDLDWNKSRDECLELIASAEILHFHHYFNLSNNPFSVDFYDVAENASFVRQFHSVPLTMAKGDQSLANEIVNSEIPQLVVSQHQERYFPNAKIVPSIIPQTAPEYLPCSNKSVQLKVGYAPSTLNSCWNDKYDYTRWDTKGSVETIAMVTDALRLSKMGSLELITNAPHYQCLLLKRECHVGIDEMVTGSFHLSSLEFLSQGVPCMAYLDNRTMETLKTLTGSDKLPWVNVMLENSGDVLVELLNDESLREELGRLSRRWIEEYYREEDLINYYSKSYDDLLNLGVVLEQPRYNPESSSDRWMAYGKYDYEWLGRVKNNKAQKKFGFLGFWK